MNSIIDLFLMKHPDSQFGAKVLIEMKQHKDWEIKRALRARSVKKGRRSKWR